MQIPELPDSRSYHGREGYVDALLDWPREWQEFRIEPTRIFAVDDERFVVDAIHRGRSLRMGIDIEVRIVWLYLLEDGLTRRWDMFGTLEEAMASINSS